MRSDQENAALEGLGATEEVEPVTIQTARPFLVIYVAWHPDFAEGGSISRVLYDHYRRELYENVAGGAGLPVVYRSTPAPESAVPIDVDLSEAETSAIVILVDKCWANDPAWVAWGQELMDRTDSAGLSARVFPVAIDDVAIRTGMAEQAVRWDQWQTVPPVDRRRRLVATLTYQFCRMLRSYLERLRRPAEEERELEQYLRKVEIFLSHSKHDENGERIAEGIREQLHARGTGLETFFDVHDIPPGTRFNKVIIQKVKVSAVVAIHTDSYSSREWCRREIIEAKRSNVPLVVVNSISDIDERGFPYMGNVPIIRMEPATADRIDYVIGCLLDEVLKDFLWRCWVELARGAAGDEIVFLPRPPELISLAGLDGRASSEATLVYPEPPIGSEEQRLFEIIAPKVRLRSMTEWLAEEGI